MNRALGSLSKFDINLRINFLMTNFITRVIFSSVYKFYISSVFYPYSACHKLWCYCRLNEFYFIFLCSSGSSSSIVEFNVPCTRSSIGHFGDGGPWGVMCISHSVMECECVCFRCCWTQSRVDEMTWNHWRTCSSTFCVAICRGREWQQHYRQWSGTGASRSAKRRRPLNSCVRDYPVNRALSCNNSPWPQLHVVITFP